MPELLQRTRAELSAEFDFSKPLRVSRAPGRLDVMGGIADYTGSLVCEMPLDRAAAVVLQPRGDRQIQVFSFNLHDEHQPFTLRMPLDGLARASVEQLQSEFSQPGRKWAGYIVGCLYALHDRKLIDLNDPGIVGMNLALLSTVPLGAGVSSSAAVEVATMMNLVEHFGLARRPAPRPSPGVPGEGERVGAAAVSGEEEVRGGPGIPGEGVSGMQVAAMCQWVENHIVGAPCGIMDQVTSCCGRAGQLLRLLCQPHKLQPPLRVPGGMRFVGINSNVKHSVGGGMYGKTRCAAFMGHAIILQAMREFGAAAGKELNGDPMKGYLANLDKADYKRYFRPYLPEMMQGQEFLDRYSATIDTATRVEPATEYHVQQATDHHVLEAMRVRKFVRFIEEADAETDPQARGRLLDQAGHLMYASHISYTNDALLGADECDLLVKLVRDREKAGLYGAKITGGGSGGTVAVFAESGARADEAIGEVMREYEAQTGRKPEAFTGTSDGAWELGTAVI